MNQTKKYNKSLITVIIAVVLLVLLSACGSKADSDGKGSADNGKQGEARGTELEGKLAEYDSVKSVFGKETSDKNVGMGIVTHIYGELSIDVNDETKKVTSILIDYNGDVSKNKFCVHKINGTISPEKLLDEMGVPEYDKSEGEYRTIGYYLEDGQSFLKVFYDKEDHMAFLSYFDVNAS